MSNTPRTDSCIDLIADKGAKDFQPIFDLCRRLERELNEAWHIVEDVSTGASLTCTKCGKDVRWCMCQYE